MQAVTPPARVAVATDFVAVIQLTGWSCLSLHSMRKLGMRCSKSRGMLGGYRPVANVS